MRQVYTLNASRPQQIVDLRFQAQYVSVVNLTAAVLYGRVGGRDYPDSRNYDFMVPAGSARVFPVVGKDFALALSVGSVGSIGGVTGFTSACEVIFLRDEYPPAMSGFDLPPTSQQATATLNAGATATHIIDARGFGSVFVSVEPGSIGPLGVVVESAVIDSPSVWGVLQAFRVQASARYPLQRVFPVGGGYIRVTVTNRHALSMSYNLTWRPFREAWAGVVGQTRNTTDIGHVQIAGMASGALQTLLSWPEYSGVLEELVVRVSGLGGVAPGLEILTTDYAPHGNIISFGSGPLSVSGTTLWYGAGSGLLVDSGADLYHWRAVLGMPFKRSISLQASNNGAGSIGTVDVFWRLTTEV